MFENLKSYVKDNDYLISLMDKKVHCYNYISINKITNNEVIIKFSKVKLLLEGKDFVLKKLDKNELLITGFISNIELR